MEPIMKNMEAAQELFGQLCQTAESGVALKKSLKPPTDPKPFVLTKPQKRRVAIPPIIIAKFDKV